MRTNPATGEHSGYYRLVESYRNMDDRVCHRTLLNVGFVGFLKPEQMNKIQSALTDRSKGLTSIFEESDAVVVEYIERYWAELVSNKKVDTPEQAKNKRHNYIDAQTMQHRDVRELGTEWLCYNAIEELGIRTFLDNQGWDEEQISLTLTQLISRAVYPYSELRTSRWIKENSAICEITGYPVENITKDKLYQNAHAIYQVRQTLEQFLSKKTNELFDIKDKIILYDLSNTYFEGRKATSKLAKFGRSKEKRTDAKLVVLALVTNMYGFVKYSSIFEGNMSDSKSLESIVDELRSSTSETAPNSTVVIDAGIATEENLQMLQKKGYNYVCVSRSKVKDPKAVKADGIVKITTKTKQTIELERVTCEGKSDYFLKVNSPGKRLKEQSMADKFGQRLEDGIELLRARLTGKYKTKKADKINQAIGRLMEKYPSAAKKYEIEVKADTQGIATSISCTKRPYYEKADPSNMGVYFLRTNMPIEDEQATWEIYNTIREIESTFRCLKTELELRPIFHKSDKATMAHINLGVTAYTIVNTIRQKLKLKDITHSWTEIKRIAQTQKLVTTRGQNQADEIIEVRKSSMPSQPLAEIQSALGYKKYPFVKKSVVHRIIPPEKESFSQSHFSTG